MKIALFGGSGFVGRKVLEMLDGSEAVTSISRRPSSPRSAVADITDNRSLESIKGNFDCAVILSAQLPQKTYTPDDLARFVDVNIKGINNILAWAASRQVKRVIYCSTLSMLPTAAATEQGLMIDIDSHYPYKITKAAGEHLVLGFCRERNMEACSLRIASVYGPGMHKDVIYTFFDKLRKGDLITIQNDRITADFVHVDDVAKTIVSSITTPLREQIVNVTSGQPVNLVQLATLLSQVLERPVPQISIVSSNDISVKKPVPPTPGLHPFIDLRQGIRELIHSWT